MFFVLVTASGRGFQEDGYIDALNNANMELDEHCSHILEWLDENMPDRYFIDDEYENTSYADVDCNLVLTFRNPSDAVAFKLAWGDEVEFESD